MGEAKDLSADQPDKAKDLLADWQTWNREQRDPQWKPDPAKKKKKAKKAQTKQ